MTNIMSFKVSKLSVMFTVMVGGDGRPTIAHRPNYR